jgi:hypothetical protein
MCFNKAMLFSGIIFVLIIHIIEYRAYESSAGTFMDTNSVVGTPKLYLIPKKFSAQLFFHKSKPFKRVPRQKTEEIFFHNE